MTKAQQIAEHFGNDGSNYDDVSGNTLDEICRDRGATVSKHHGTVVYEFEDGSAIVDEGCAWDIRAEGCDNHCWDGGGEGCHCPADC